MTTFNYRAEMFREGNLYVARCPDLGVSSFGGTIDEARDSLQEAVEAFLKDCGMVDAGDEVRIEFGLDGTSRSAGPTDEEAVIAMLFLDGI